MHSVVQLCTRGSTAVYNLALFNGDRPIPTYAYSYIVDTYLQNNGGAKSFKDGATRKMVAFCENCFCHNLKTNKVKYIKVYIFRKEISRGIYLNSQIFG